MPTAEEIKQSLLGLDPNSRYAVRVRSVDGLGNKSEWSEALEFSTTGAGSRPVRPSGISVSWGGKDADIRWSPVIVDESGSSIDVSHYEINVVLPSPSPDTLVTKKYIVEDTYFTYTYDMLENDFGSGGTSEFFFYILAVSIGGLKSEILIDSLETFYSNVTPAVHQHNETPSAPSVYGVDNGIVVSMDRGPYDCFDRFVVDYSTDGGSSYFGTSPDPTESPYIHKPTQPGEHYFKYKRRCIFEQETPSSPASYGEGSVTYTLTTDTDDFNASHFAKVRFGDFYEFKPGLVTAVIKITPEVFPVDDFCFVTVAGVYEFKFPMKQGDTWYTITMPAENFNGYLPLDFDFFIDGQEFGHAEVKLTGFM